MIVALHVMDAMDLDAPVHDIMDLDVSGALNPNAAEYYPEDERLVIEHLPMVTLDAALAATRKRDKSKDLPEWYESKDDLEYDQLMLRPWRAKPDNRRIDWELYPEIKAARLSGPLATCPVGILLTINNYLIWMNLDYFRLRDAFTRRVLSNSVRVSYYSDWLHANRLSSTHITVDDAHKMPFNGWTQPTVSYVSDMNTVVSAADRVVGDTLDIAQSTAWENSIKDQFRTELRTCFEDRGCCRLIICMDHVWIGDRDTDGYGLPGGELMWWMSTLMEIAQGRGSLVLCGTVGRVMTCVCVCLL